MLAVASVSRSHNSSTFPTFMVIKDITAVMQVAASPEMIKFNVVEHLPRIVAGNKNIKCIKIYFTRSLAPLFKPLINRNTNEPTKLQLQSPVFSTFFNPVTPPVTLLMILANGLTITWGAEMFHFKDYIIMAVTKSSHRHIAKRRSCCRRTSGTRCWRSWSYVLTRVQAGFPWTTHTSYIIMFYRVSQKNRHLARFGRLGLF